MRFNPDIHHRKSIRLPGYDYSQPGAYFITICTHHRQPLFGEIVNGSMMLNDAGITVEKCWQTIPQHYSNMTLGEYIVMPNHFHGIVHVGALLAAPKNNANPKMHVGALLAAPKKDTGTNMHVGAPLAAPKKDTGTNMHVGAPLAAPKNNASTKQGAASSAPTIGTMLRRFKSTSAIAANRCLNRDGQPLWQRNYYEHIIRDELTYLNIAEYIRTNPLRWRDDVYCTETI